MLVRSTKRCHCRCRKCETRRVLPKKPSQYVRLQPICSGYGSRNWRADTWMNQRDTSTKGMGCQCGGYPWDGASVHRKGSPWCRVRKDGTPRYPGDPDFKDAYS